MLGTGTLREAMASKVTRTLSARETPRLALESTDGSSEAEMFSVKSELEGLG